jgi:hypothetical protein
MATYTIISSLSTAPITFERFAEACMSLAALRANQPHSSHSLQDADGFIIPSTEILKGLAIMKAAAEQQLQQIATYAAQVAPAYQPEADAPAAEIATQAIKAGVAARAKLPADSIAGNVHYCITTTLSGLTCLRMVGDIAEAQSYLSNYLRQADADDSRYIESKDFSAPAPAGYIELQLWLMWGTKIHLQRRFFLTADTEQAPPVAPLAVPVAECRDYCSTARVGLDNEGAAAVRADYNAARDAAEAQHPGATQEQLQAVLKARGYSLSRIHFEGTWQQYDTPTHRLKVYTAEQTKQRARAAGAEEGAWLAAELFSWQ